MKETVLQKIVALILIPIVGSGVFIFSFLGSFGAWISIGERAVSLNGPLDDDILMPLLGIAIGLIIVIPIIQLIFKAAGKRWQTMLRALFFLIGYLVVGVLAIIASIFIAGFFSFFDNDNSWALVSLCRTVSATLAIGYYFYFKKIIKPLALK